MNIFHQVFSLSTMWSFKRIENKHDAYREDCMKKFSEFLREHAMKIIDFTRKMLLKKLLTKVTNKRTLEIIWKCKHLLYL